MTTVNEGFEQLAKMVSKLPPDEQDAIGNIVASMVVEVASEPMVRELAKESGRPSARPWIEWSKLLDGKTIHEWKTALLESEFVDAIEAEAIWRASLLAEAEQRRATFVRDVERQTEADARRIADRAESDARQVISSAWNERYLVAVESIAESLKTLRVSVTRE